MSVLLGTRWNVHLTLHCLFMSFFLTRTWDRWMTEAQSFLFCFRFIDWWTGINERTLHYHFLILCQVIPPPSLHSSFALQLSDFILSCRCFPSVSRIYLGVHDEMASGHSAKKYRRSLEKKQTHHVLPPHAAFACHFLSAHSDVCKWARTCTRAGTHVCTYVHMQIH